MIVEEIHPRFGGLTIKVRHTAGELKGQTEIVNSKMLFEAVT